MLRVAHLSDLHFGRTDAVVVEALLDDLREVSPNLVVVSGDLTERALHAQFLEARRFLDRLPAPWLAVPGNHDVPLYALAERFVRPMARFRAHVSADLEQRFESGGLAVFGMNSAHGTTWKHGRALDRTVDRLCEAAENSDAAIRIVVAHHPFLAPPDHPRLRVIDGAARALRRFAESRIDVVLGGHVHRAYACEASRHHTLPRDLLVIQAPTATSTHLRDEPQGYNLLTIRTMDAEVEIEVRSWREAAFRGERHARFPLAARPR